MNCAVNSVWQTKKLFFTSCSRWRRDENIATSKPNDLFYFLFPPTTRRSTAPWWFFIVAEKRNGATEFERSVSMCVKIEPYGKRVHWTLRRSPIGIWMDGLRSSPTFLSFFLSFSQGTRNSFRFFLRLKNVFLLWSQTGTWSDTFWKFLLRVMSRGKKITAERRKKRMKLNDHRDDVIKWIFSAWEKFF